MRSGPTDPPVAMLSRAYLALVDTSGYAFGKCSEEGAILLRDSKEFVHYRGATWIPHREPCSQWLVDEGHMPYIWSLAEGSTVAECAK